MPLSTTFEGVYSSEKIPLKINIRKDSEKYYAQATGQLEFPLDKVSETEFKFAPAGIIIEFLPKGGRLILKQGGMNIKFDKE